MYFCFPRLTVFTGCFFSSDFPKMVGQTAATWIKNVIIPYLRNKQSSSEDLGIPCAAGWAAQGDKASFLKLWEGPQLP